MAGNPLTIKARGLHTFKNYYADFPEGALTKASNVVIDRDDIIEPRPGFKQFGTQFSSQDYRAKQLFEYKTRLLRHVSNSSLQYESDQLGTFANFAGSYTEPETNIRIKSVEQNGNFYFLTSGGVKKLSAVDAAGLSSAVIIDAGGVKALSLSGTADYNTIGFLEPQKQTAYVILWAYKDNNENLILGVPSQRFIIQNLKALDPSGNSNSNTNLTFNIPSQILNYPTSIKENYFYQVYRTIQTGLDIDPGSEFNLVFEDYPSSAQLTSGVVAISDITPDDIRVSGTLLYTNPTSGEGINQANYSPPFAKDITAFKGYTFYANTATVQRLFLDYLSVEGILSGNTFSVTDGVNTKTYLFQGAVESEMLDYSASTLANFKNPGGVAKYFTIDASTIKNVPAERSYYVWFFDTNETDPALVGKLGIKVIITAAISTDNVADLIKSTIEGTTGTIDFNITVNTAANSIVLKHANNGYVQDQTPTTNIPGLTIITDGSGLGEDIATGKIFLPYKPTATETFGPSTSQQLEQVAISTIDVINGDNTGFIYGFYQSGPETIPGKMLFEQRSTTGSAFRFYTLDGIEGQFNPTLGTTAISQDVISTNEVRPNRVYYSKYQQPEAVPLVNFFDVGPRDKKIQRIIALRDALFIFKEEGIYRVTGDVAPFAIQDFDSSVFIRGVDSAKALNNQIYALTSQGVITVTDTGVEVISRNIENIFTQITRPGFAYETATFGVAYETDRAYLLYTVKEKADTSATVCFRYNTFTKTWTSWDMNKICGLVKFQDDKLYLGPADIPQIEQQRKNLEITDFADREYELSIGSNAIDGVLINISSATNAGDGDAISQVQYLTIAQFNRLLRKLDIDTQVADSDYEALLTAVPGDSLRNKLVLLANKLDADASIIQTDYFTSIDTKVASGVSIATGTSIAIVTSTAHGLLNGRYITVSGSTTTPNINGTYPVTVINANSFSIPVTVTVSGTINYLTPSTDFKDIQGCFNIISTKLNADAGAFFTNYDLSVDTIEYRAIITNVDANISQVTVSQMKQLIEGPITLYKAIYTVVQYAPIFGQDPTIEKQFSYGTFRFEANNFSKITISYASDLSPSFESETFTEIGTGEWGDYGWDATNWGGTAAPIPIRTFIPRQKQRCTFLIPKFEHKTAIEKYSLMYISVVMRSYSNRAYKGK